jgi:transcriptional regulator with XRE-family HTH domain
VDLTPYDVEDAVGVAFRLTRRRMRLSQRELAALLGWDASMVGRWETGRVSRALGRVDGILRAMGFRLVVVALDAREWADVEAPVEHLADRGFRHLPAHLDQLALPSNRRPIHWFLRHRDKPNPMAPDWTYEMRPRDRATWQRLSESRRDSQA